MTAKYHIDLFWSEADGAWVADVPIFGHAPPWETPRPRRLRKSKRRWRRGWKWRAKTDCRYLSRFIEAPSRPPVDHP